MRRVGRSTSDGDKSPMRRETVHRSSSSSGAETAPSMIRRPLRSISASGLPTSYSGKSGGGGGGLGALGVAMGSPDSKIPRSPGQRGRGRQSALFLSPGKVLAIFCLLATLSATSLYLGVRSLSLSRRLGALEPDLDRATKAEEKSRNLQRSERERASNLSSKMSSISAQKGEVERKNRELTKAKIRLEDDHAHLEQMAADKDQEIMNLRRELNKTKGKAKLTAEASLNNVVDPEREKREMVLLSRMTDLRAHIARESYRTTLERFGPGPHRVSMRLQLPADTENFPNMPENPTIVIQLNPLDEMPLSVHLFLEQVAHKLWDGCSFALNAFHILQAGTSALAGEKMKKFTDMRLDKLSYQEYHEKYPHEKYTVGFAGRPGGPDFYINKMDNSANHGPGGQTQVVLNEEADPCFGRILEGKDIIDRIGSLMSNNFNMLNTPVSILQAEVLGMDTVPTRWKADQDFSVLEGAAISAGVSGPKLPP